MRYALCPENRDPAPGDVLASREHLARLASALPRRRGAFALYRADAPEEDEPEWGFTPVARLATARGMTAEEVGAWIRQEALRDARWIYMNGDCWSFAVVAARRLGRPIATVLSTAGDAGEPDHLAVDLGEGLYLDVRGVLAEEGLLAGLSRGAHVPPERYAPEEIFPLFARYYGADGYSLEDSLACGGFEEETGLLVDLFLEEEAKAAIEAAALLAPTP